MQGRSDRLSGITTIIQERCQISAAGDEELEEDVDVERMEGKQGEKEKNA